LVIIEKNLMTTTPPDHISAEATVLRYQALMQQTEDLITLMDLEGRYIAANQPVKEAFGLTDETLTQYAYWDVIPPDELAHARSVYERLLTGEVLPKYERTFVRHDGTIFIGEVNVMLIRDQNGKPYEILSIIRDQTERKRLQKQLVERQFLDVQLQKEQEINRLRSDLLMKINHEFRTPLAIINTYTTLIERHFERLTPERREEYIRHVRDNIHRVSDMLDDLYLIYQTQSGAHKDKELFDVVNVVEDVVAQIQKTSGRDHHFATQFIGDIPPFNGYERLIWHTLYNILINAVRYSPMRTPIALEVMVVDNGLVVRVVDKGIGIPQSDLDRILEPFFRSDNASHIEGTGLGLSVVSETVRAHGGELVIDSTVNIGTTVTIRLPYSL